MSAAAACRPARAARGRPPRPRAGSRRSTGTRRRRRTAPCRGLVSRSTSSHCSRFVSWNSSTMIERNRSCSRSRSVSFSRSRSRARAGDPRSRAPTRDPWQPSTPAAKPSSSSCSSSRSRSASSSSAACSTALARFLVRRCALAARPQATQIEQPLGELRRFRQDERLRGRGARASVAPTSSARQRAASASSASRASSPGRSPSSSASSRPAERSVS